MNENSVLFQELSEEELNRCAVHYLGEEIVDWELLTGGLFNTTYFLETASRRVVLRLGPVNRDRLLPYEEELMRTEPQIQELLHSNGVPTSKTLVLDIGKEFLNRDVAIVEYIPGRNMAERTMRERERKDVEQQIGMLARRIHTITANDLDHVPEKPFGRTSLVLSGKGSASWKKAVLEEVRQWCRSAERIGLFDKGFRQRVEQVFEKFGYLFEHVKEPVLVHGDLWYGNVLLNDSGSVAAIIDADRSLFGDPEFEFSMLLMDRKNFLEGYGIPIFGSREDRLRAMLYKFMVDLEDCYILRHEYCRERDSIELQSLLYGKLRELESAQE